MKERRTRWSRRLLSLLLAAVLTAALVPTARAAESMGNFKKIRDYEGFSDVSESAWYYSDVRAAYELGLISGSNGAFEPTGKLTIAQAITMACNVNHIYEDDNFTPGGSPWYQNAVEYAKSWNIISAGEYSDYNAPATRADVARMFANSLPDYELARINRIAWIPDVDWWTENNDYVYVLYNAGVLTGGDGGQFRPEDSITRAEAAAILNRVADPSKRVSFSLTENAPGKVVESQDGALRVSVPADGSWIMSEGSTPGESAWLDFTHEDNYSEINFSSYYKSAIGKDMEGFSDDMVTLVQQQGGVLDGELESIWYRGLDAVAFSYTRSQSNGLTAHGLVICVENSDCIVCIIMMYADGCADEVIDEVQEIGFTLDLSL